MITGCVKQQLKTTPPPAADVKNKIKVISGCNAVGGNKHFDPPPPVMVPEVKREKKRRFVFNNAEVIGYLDRPVPLFILDTDYSSLPAADGFAQYASAKEFSTEEYDRIYENP
jgi:hypothetical protein